MHKIIVFAWCGYLLSVTLNAQVTDIGSVLRQIEQNNRELKALTSLTESSKLDLKSSNNLPDPQFGAYYLPFGDHPTGDYSEFQVSQRFEFPTIYGIRNSLVDQQSNQLELDYQTRRQEILVTARKYCLQLIHLNKRLTTEQNRVQQAQTVFEQTQELYEKEQVGILELNKAKVSWMQDQFKIRQIQNDHRNLILLLENLNGGNAISFDGREYISSLALPEKDSLWQDKLERDPLLVLLRQEESIAEKRLQLSKNRSLPNITAGYNRQGVSGAYYSGIYAGISIPLWSNRNKVKSARSHLEYRESFTDSKTRSYFTSFEKQYNEYQILFDKLREYQSVFTGLDSDELLIQAYQLGEISFIEYYMELQFYRDAYDAMLEMENQLYQLQTDLLKYQL